jgi:hypothetical protein
MKTKIIVCLLFLVLFVYAGSALAFTESGTNSFFGSGAGFNNSGFENTFIGFSAGSSNTSGIANTFIGRDAGFSNSTGSGNVFLGSGAGGNETSSNNLYIDNSDTSSPLIYGEFDTPMVEINGDFYVTGDTYMTSDARLKKDINSIDSSLEKIMSLRGVSFKWNGQKSKDLKLSKRTHYGVIAQEVQNTLPDIVMKDRNGEMNVAYMELIPVLIEAVKEQQQIISEMAEKIQHLERDLKLKGNLAMVETN